MKITLCGSTRFMNQFHDANGKLTLAGHVVYSVALSSHGLIPMTEEEKTVLDLVHLRKIFDSEAIVVVGVESNGDQYIGESTRREIQWASILGRQIYFWRLDENSLTTDWAPVNRVI